MEGYFERQCGFDFLADSQTFKNPRMCRKPIRGAIMKQRVLGILIFLVTGISQGLSQTVPSGGGLVIFKAQQFLPDSMAQAMVFSQSIDHGSVSGGSTIFIGASGGRALVQANGLIGIYTAEEINMTNLAPGDSLNKCKGTIDRLDDLSRLNANVGETIAPILNVLRRDVAAVASGKEMINGQWKDQEHTTIPQVTSQIVQREIKQSRIETLKTTEGDTYKNATYKSSDEAKVAFSHADGAARISWDLLKKENQLAWGYDAEKVKVERLAKQQAEEEKIAAELLAKKQAQEANSKADTEAKAAAEKVEKEKQQQIVAQETARLNLTAALEGALKETAKSSVAEGNNTPAGSSYIESKTNISTTANDLSVNISPNDEHPIGPVIKGICIGMNIQKAKAVLSDKLSNSRWKTSQIYKANINVGLGQIVKGYRFNIYNPTMETISGRDNGHDREYGNQVEADGNGNIFGFYLVDTRCMASLFPYDGSTEDFIKDFMGAYNIPKFKGANSEDRYHSAYWHYDDPAGVRVSIDEYRCLSVEKIMSAQQRTKSFN